MDDQHSQSLVDVIVKIPGDTSALFFLGREESSGQFLQLLPAGGECVLTRAERLFCLDMFGDFVQQRAVHVSEFLGASGDPIFQFVFGLAEVDLHLLPLPQQDGRYPDDDQTEGRISHTDPDGNAAQARPQRGSHDEETRGTAGSEQRKPRIGRGRGEQDDP